MEKIDLFYVNLARFFVGIQCVLVAVGMVCNALILLTTIKTKTLRSTCNLLIAICAAGDFFQQAGIFAELPFLFGYDLEIDSLLCTFIMFLPEMGIAVGCSCIFCIGLDRMISVLFTIRYRALDKRYYHSFLAAIIFGYCGYYIFIMVAFARRRVTTCAIMAVFPGDGFVYFVGSGMAFNLASILVYAITFSALKTGTDTAIMKRIGKSLFIIVTVDIGGWFLTPALIVLAIPLGFDANQSFTWSPFCAIFVTAAVTMKLFIFYFTSSEYRSAFDNYLFHQASINKSTSSVVPKTTVL